MACKHGDYEGASCAHCGPQPAPAEERRLAERERKAPDHTERALAEQLWFAAKKCVESNAGSSSGIYEMQQILFEARLRPLDASLAADWVTTGHGVGPDGKVVELGHSVGIHAREEAIAEAETIGATVCLEAKEAWAKARECGAFGDAATVYENGLLNAAWNAERKLRERAEAHRELRAALKIYADEKNWKRSRPDGPVDEWVHLHADKWNGPDLARAALSRVAELEGR